MNTPFIYLNRLSAMIEEICAEEAAEIEACAKAFARTLENGRPIFLFGTGHSHMLAEELFYRAGGLVNVQPVLETALMLHESASKSTEMERLPHYADILFESYSMTKDDVIVIISNSGRNGVPVDLALKAKAEGLTVIALTNLNHSSASASRHPSGKKLYEIADLVLDNCAPAAEAMLEVPGIEARYAAASGIASDVLLWSMTSVAIEKLQERGITPGVLKSANFPGGNDYNKTVIEPHYDEYGW